MLFWIGCFMVSHLSLFSFIEVSCFNDNGTCLVMPWSHLLLCHSMKGSQDQVTLSYGLRIREAIQSGEEIQYRFVRPEILS